MDLKKESSGEASKVVKRRVEDARKRQYERYGKEVCNSRAGYEELLNSSPLTVEQHREMQQLAIKNDWSNRTQVKIVRLARTISDLNGSRSVTNDDIWEAVKLNQNQ